MMPDTAFGISRLLDDRQSSVEFNRLREALALNGPYIVVQPTDGLDSFLNFVKKHSHRLRKFRFLALPIGPVLGDHEAILGEKLPGLIRLRAWPHPLLLAELISQAAAVVGRSYHMAITALSFGVPVFSSADLAAGKHAALSAFESVYSLPDETDPDWFMTRIGKTKPTPAALAARDRLTQHWDHVAAAISERRSTGTQRAVSQFLQSLPNLLESEAIRYEVLTNLEASRYEALRQLLEVARAEIAARDDRIEKLLNSPSWRVTTPFRFVMRTLKKLAGK